MNTKILCFPRIIASMGRKVFLPTLLAIALLLSPLVAYGAAVTLAWDANTEPDLAGYKIHYGTASRDYSHSIDVGNTTQHTLANLDDGTTYYLAATAYNEDDNQSSYSVELVHTTAENTHTITALAGVHGSISPSGSLTVDHGSNRTFTISADATYHIHNVLVDGVSVGAVSTYTITNVIQNHTIAASFTADNLPPIANAGPDQTANEGAVVKLKGYNSLDPDDSIAAYSWSQTSGPPVHLSNPGQIEANFTSPNVVPSGETLVFQLVVTDNQGLQAMDSCSVYVTREPVTDSDGDGVPDEQDEFPYDADEHLDTDGDGEGNNADTDDDNDGMPDTWELLYGLDPLKDDAADDPDGDEISNINEYNLGSEPNFNESNFAPDPPQLLNPNNYEIVGLTPLLVTDEFYDPNIDDVHSQTQWKIIRVHDDFCVFDVTTNSSLTALKVPKLILEEDIDYIWQVKFIDNKGTASQLSEAGYFTTELLEQDSDGNGVLDHQEVDTTIDLDQDGNMDRNQEDIKCVATETGGFKICLGIRDADNADSIVSIQSETPDSIDLLLSALDGPKFLAFGLIHFSLLVKEPGDEVQVTIYLSKAAYDDGIWYKYDPVNSEWVDYSDFIDFSADRKTVYLTLTDGGFGDADGIENGVIVDPLALRTATDHSSGSDSFVENIADSITPDVGCFVSAASPARPSVGQALGLWHKIRGNGLLTLFILMIFAYFGKEFFLRSEQNRRNRQSVLIECGSRNGGGGNLLMKVANRT